jgi:hypothetical protein
MVLPANGILSDRGDVPLVAVHDQAVPAPLREQEARIGFTIRFHAKLDKVFPGDSDMPDKVIDDPVFAPLREHLEFMLTQRRRRQAGGLARFDPPECFAQMLDGGFKHSHTLGHFIELPVFAPEKIERFHHALLLSVAAGFSQKKE